MSNKKSLGSSPIAFKKKKSSMAFIPDRNAEEAKTEQKVPVSASSASKSSAPNKSAKSKENQKSEKKVVSYYLEVDLVDRIKSVADQKDIYYSSLVAMALREWITNHA